MRIEGTSIVSEFIKHTEMWNFFARFRYKIIDVFGVKIRFTKKQADECEKELRDIKMLATLLGYSIKVKGNHTIVIFTFTDEARNIDVEFHVYNRLVIDQRRPYKENSKIKRITIIDYITTKTHEESNDYLKFLLHLKSLL